MTPDTTVSYGPNGPWPVLPRNERRVLGVLVEKAKTSADGYPMTINALVTGCNQKSNRDPVLDLEEDDVEQSLSALKNRGLVCKVMSGRVDKWRHLLYESWHIDKREMAVLAELLLRGTQTEGELRTRASRMEPIPDLDSLKQYLRPLLERGLVLYLTPEDRRGAVITHGFHDPAELHRLKAHFSAGPASVTPPPAAAAAPTPAPAPRVDDRVPALESGLAALRDEVARLRADLATTRQELATLKQSLGG